MAGFFEPSEEDKNPEKKPRFRQDLVAFAIMFVAGVIAIVVTMLS